MTPTEVLLIGGDTDLVAQIDGVVRAVRACRLERIGEAAQYAEYAGRHGVPGLVAVSIADGKTDRDDALQLLERLNRNPTEGRPVPLVVLDGETESPDRLLFLRRGAVDYLTRPLSLSRLAMLVDVFTMRRRCLAPVALEASAPLPDPAAYLANSPNMRALMERVATVAHLSTTVLLTGETGTGKTRLAQRIHDLSPRRESPFLAVNCGGLSATLIESEMFGHARGAFTGADRDHEGKFTQVDSGTLLLDEVDAMPMSIQASLLRAVEERVYEPVGSGKSLQLKARLVVACNTPLEEQVAERRFRADLYYRLNVISFRLPSLRERREDIEPLAQQFIANFADEHGIPAKPMTQPVLAALKAHDWPGNIRELRNTIERSLVLSRGDRLELEDLPEAVTSGGGDVDVPSAPIAVGGNSLATARSSAEVARLQESLQRNQGNRTSTARELGISRAALYKKMHKYGLI